MQSNNEKAWRNDAEAKVTGRARYTDDLKVHGMLHAVPVYADHVHARITRLDTRAAEKADGVVRVITAKEIPGAPAFGQIKEDYPLLAHETLRCHGDVVALVVAKTREAAIAASREIIVEADALPAVLDPEEALEPGAPLVHPAAGTNEVCHHKIRRGDVKKGFAQSDLVVEAAFETQRVEHAYLEPESALCIPRQDGVMEVHGSMQHPFSTRRFCAAFLGVPFSEVEVRSVPMGGGFGGKDDTAALVCARTALAARLTGRPVKMTYDREWSLRESYKRHPYRLRYRMGLNRDGTIRAVEVEGVVDGGAYCSVTPWVTWRSTVQCCGPYRVEHVRCDLRGAYTNNVFSGAMRGFGSPQINFCVEQLMDMAGEKLGLSPIEIRRKNMLRLGDTTITGQKLDNHMVSTGQVLDGVVREMGYEEKLARCTFGKGASEEQYGVGLAMSYRGMSLGAEGMDRSAAIVNVQFDGSVLLETSIHENGQGAESAMILLLAEALGIRKERIRYRMPSTSNIPDGGTTVASRGTLMGGGAVVEAARKLKEKMAEILAPHLACKAEELVFQDDRISGKKKSIPFDEAMDLLFLSRRFAHAYGDFRAPQVTWDDKTGSGRAYFTWVYGCQAVELTVNRKTGKITLLNGVAAHDVGRAVNRAMLLGQVYGGMAMGTGYALHEEVKLEEGRVVTCNLDSYRIPRARDLPEMKGLIVENHDPNSPSGAKGIGEPANELMAPAIANALYHATGKRHFRLPMGEEANS